MIFRDPGGNLVSVFSRSERGFLASAPLACQRRAAGARRARRDREVLGRARQLGRPVPLPGQGLLRQQAVLRQHSHPHDDVRWRRDHDGRLRDHLYGRRRRADHVDPRPLGARARDGHADHALIRRILSARRRRAATVGPASCVPAPPWAQSDPSGRVAPHPRDPQKSALSQRGGHITLCNPQRGRECISCDRWNALPYCAVMAGLSRTSRTGFVSSSSATASRDFTKSENER
jgi:hypothetical protein